MWIIYKHTNKINGKSYIGQTCQKPSERWRSNGVGYSNNAPIFYRAIQKYGWNNFEHTILEDNIPTKEEANEREKYWISYYDCCILDGKDKGYNVNRGGEGFSSELASKLSKNNWNNAKYREKICKKIICVNNQKIYSSIIEASKDTGISKTGIAKACCKKHKSAGKDNKGLPIVWEYYEEGRKYEYENPLLQDKKLKKVICLTTGEIFNSITEANKKYNITTISECLSGKSQTTGQLSDGTRLCWDYYDENKQYNFKTGLGKSHKKVRCVNNNLIFNTIKEGAEYAKRAPSNLSAHLHGRGKSCGVDEKGNKMKWEFVEV